MKKAICLTLVILSIASCLTACSFTSNIMNAQKDKAESTPKVKEMMSAMTEKSVSDATSLLHPEANEKADDAIEQIVSYVNGRSVSSMELMNINVTSSTGTSGKMRKKIYSKYLSNNYEIKFKQLLKVIFCKNQHTHLNQTGKR